MNSKFLAIFDVEKLKWFNRHYLLELPEADYAVAAMATLADALVGRVAWDEHVGRKLVPVVQERVSIWHDIRTMAADGEFDFYFAPPQPDTALIPNKGSDTVTAKRHLEHASATLTGAAPEAWMDAEQLKALLWEYAGAEGRGDVLWPLRYALSGRKKSPDPFVIMSIIGRNATLERVTSAIAML
jgi:glutamyl/glutaminyl-tRNA synthetase